MLSSLLQRREQIVARHDATLDRWWPDKKNPEFRRDVSAVVAELETSLDEFETAGMPVIEPSRTARASDCPR